MNFKEIDQMNAGFVLIVFIVMAFFYAIAYLDSTEKTTRLQRCFKSACDNPAAIETCAKFR